MSGPAPPSRRRVEVLASPEAVAERAAELALESLVSAGGRHGVARLVLAGGSTPRRTYRRLAARHTPGWPEVHWFWSDERCVPPDASESNYRMAREALLEPLGAAAGRVHRIEGELAPEVAARRYEERLRRHAPGGFDLVLLGLGADAHTASLFPGRPPGEEERRWVAPVTAPIEPRHRVTLTCRALRRCRAMLFVVTGAGKAAAVRQVLGAAAAAPEAPVAARLAPAGGAAVWLLDRAAAGGRVSFRRRALC